MQTADHHIAYTTELPCLPMPFYLLFTLHSISSSLSWKLKMTQSLYKKYKSPSCLLYTCKLSDVTMKPSIINKHIHSMYTQPMLACEGHLCWHPVDSKDIIGAIITGLNVEPLWRGVPIQGGEQHKPGVYIHGSSTGGLGLLGGPHSYYRGAAKSLCDRNFVLH